MNIPNHGLNLNRISNVKIAIDEKEDHNKPAIKYSKSISYKNLSFRKKYSLFENQLQEQMLHYYKKDFSKGWKRLVFLSLKPVHAYLNFVLSSKQVMWKKEPKIIHPLLKR